MKTKLAFTIPGFGDLTHPCIPRGGITTGQSVIQIALIIMLIVSIILSIIFAIWSGLQMILSGGDKQKIQAARARLTYALVGLAVSLASFFILSIVAHFFGVKLLG